MGWPRGLSPVVLGFILMACTAVAADEARSTGYLPPEFDLPYVRSPWPSTAPLAPLPDKFDWREQGLVSPVKDQGSCGACYAFAGLANFEARVGLDGGGTFDFSENNIKECEPQQYRCVGGNYWIVANHLSTRGAVLETCDPYSPSITGCNQACPAFKTLLEWRVISELWIPEPEELKALIMEYGPIFSAINSGHGDLWYSEFNSYDGSYTLFYEGTGKVNHAVAIVGWDDSLHHDGGRGGWIAKNSWGTSWGGPCDYGTEGGYFTIAYGSAKIGQATSYLYRWQDYDPDERLLYYDEAGATYPTGYPPNLHAWGMCNYWATEDLRIRRVEFWTVDAVTDADIYIYDDFDGSTVSNLIASKLDLAFDNMGYHSVELDQEVPVEEGDHIYVVLKLRDVSFTKPLSYDYKVARTPGSSYTSSDGIAWVEFTGGDLGIRLRVAAGGDQVPPEIGLRVEPQNACCGDLAITAEFSEEISDTSLRLTVRGEAVPMEQETLTRYRALHQIPGGGAVPVGVSARDLAGNLATAELQLMASVVRRDAGGTAASGDDALEVVVGPDTFEADSVFILISATAPGTGVLKAYEVYPAEVEDFSRFRDFVEVSIAYDDTVSEPRNLCLARLEWGTGQMASTLESFVDTTAHRVIAYVDSLGPLGLYRSEDVASTLMPRAVLSVVPSYPNPSQESATIIYDIGEAGRVDVRVYSVDGRLVSRVFSGHSSRGLHRLQWNGIDARGKKVAAGVYYVRVESRGASASTKLVIVN